MPKYFKQSWTGNFYKSAYGKLLSDGANDVSGTAAVVADFTGDGIPDVLQFLGSNAWDQPLGSAPSQGQFVLLAGKANGTFRDATALLPAGGTNVGPHPGELNAVTRHLMVGDVNGDGRPDILTALSYEDGRLIGEGNGTNVAVQQIAYVSNGPGHWNIVELDNLTWGHGLEVDDFDGDGRDDVITGGFTITPGHQGGTVLSRFTANGVQSNTPLPIGGGTMQLADLDGDGDNELLGEWAQYDDQGRVTDSGLEVRQMIGGALQGAMPFSTFVPPHHYEDGYAWNGNLVPIAVHRDANGDYLLGSMDNIKTADLDGDGKEEIIGLQGRKEIGRRADGKIDDNLSHGAQTEVTFFGWNGTSIIERTDMSVQGFAPALYGIYDYSFADFNFDGHLDLIVPRWDAPGDTPMQVFLNDGAGRFKAIANKLLPKDPPGGDDMIGEVLDINGDRIMDILVRTDSHSEAGPAFGQYTEAMYLGTIRFHTGPDYSNPALKGAAGFNEQYYLNTYADAAKAVKKHKFDSGLDHYLEVGAKKGYLGFAANTHIFGSDKNDTIKAREGHERLDGGLGKDTLTGKSGADEFVFSTKLGASNVDTIKDFKPGQGDTIGLDHHIFKKIGAVLDDNEFFAKKGAAKAHDRDDRIIYDTKSGKLYYDADGSKKGGHDAVLFATLSKKPHLDHGDFDIV